MLNFHLKKKPCQKVLKYILLIFILTNQCLKSQPLRGFSFCDSTVYNLNNDTDIIAGRHKLYLKNSFNITTLYNFYDGNPDYYIRDFDIIKPDLWYTVIGSRYIGDLTKLYKSTNKGLTWMQDTAYFSAIDSSLLSSNLGFNPFDPYYYKSINQIQKIGKDSVLIFLGYYMSGILYSTNSGASWNHWFGNMPAHYHGMFACKNKYYLYQLEGDGFVGRMFSFEKQYIFRNDSLVNFDHLPTGSGQHPDFTAGNVSGVLYYTNVNWCTFFNTLSDTINSQCSSATFIPNKQKQKVDFLIFPNPASNSLYVKVNTEAIIQLNLYLKLYDVFGNEVMKCPLLSQKNNMINITNMIKGLYFYKIISDKVEIKIGKIFIE